ncbi:acyl-CoA thioesterase [Paenibacillus protaetiae]|uniref:Acyl-CoA thioesterase n=1 Tax=Paenibacillus protaetiae TaxID=2509456 RepID=A0A4P6EZR4_9BACL|nr:thioesterase family protein [Paenibacillus protaetiae]QAY68275.1 acyl-CoA thioesterase [Paenibacillus protaetiae]
MAVVFHGNYLTWFEIGRTELLRSLGYDYKSVEAKGLLLPVIDLNCSYIAPAKYDDTLLVFTRVSSFSKIKLNFEAEVRRVEAAEHAAGWHEDGKLPGELLVRGGTRHAWVNAAWQPARLDKYDAQLYELLAKATS